MSNKAGRPGPPTAWRKDPVIEPVPPPPRRHNGGSASDDDEGGEDDTDSSDSDDVEEDEYGAELTPALDAAILRTLAKIRSKQGVYAGERVLEEELKEAEEKVRVKGIKGGVVKRDEGKVG